MNKYILKVGRNYVASNVIGFAGMPQFTEEIKEAFVFDAIEVKTFQM